MAYKAVFVDNGPVIVHYNSRHYPAGSPLGGQFAPAPYGSAVRDYYHDPNNYDFNSKSASSSSSSSSSSTPPSSAPSNNAKNPPLTSSQMNSIEKRTNELIRSGGEFAKSFVKEPARPKLDLSGFTDEELRSRNTRAQLEADYNKWYNPPKEDHTKEFIDRAVAIGGLAVGIGGLAMQVVPAIIKAKKGGS